MAADKALPAHPAQKRSGIYENAVQAMDRPAASMTRFGLPNSVQTHAAQKPRLVARRQE